MNKNKEELVIGLDSSTTGTKAIAWNKNGGAVAQGRETIGLSSPRPGYYEQNPLDWWTSAQKVLKSITRQIDPKRIEALAVSNQRETFVPLNGEGKHIRPAIVWLDERCKTEVESFSRKIGQKKIHNITGKPVDYAPVVYRLAWMKKNEPRFYTHINMICDVQTYLVRKLTGFFSTSWASADPLGLFDLKHKTWSGTILRALELKEEQLPETYCPGTVMGRLTEAAAKPTGLMPGTFIVAGGGDGQAAGLGVNALTPDRAYLNLGTAVVSGIYGTVYRTSRAFRTMSSCSENGYYYECSLRAGSFTLDWFIKNILKIDPRRDTDIYARLEQEARDPPAGSRGLMFLPYLCGVMNPYWDPDARGAFVGLSASHDRGHLYRALLEGISFEQLFATEKAEKAAGTRVNDFIVIGGGASSNLWCRIMADVSGKNICLPRNTEASCLGAGICAAVGAGWYDSFQQAAEHMTGIEKTIKPDMNNHKIYAGLFGVYKKIYPALKKAVRSA
jgi:sugar (pentulose or hexulose) kinase